MYDGKLVRLRAYDRKDIDKAWEYVNDPEVKRFLVPGIPFPLRKDDEAKWYESLNPSSTNSYSFAIERLADGEYIGGCGINEVDWKNSHALVGIFLGKQFCNNGYSTDAMRVLVNFIFSEMNLHKVSLLTYGFNKRAIRSYEKVGFKVEGVLKENIYREGRYHDEIIMSIFKEEWKNPSADEPVRI